MVSRFRRLWHGKTIFGDTEGKKPQCVEEVASLLGSKGFRLEQFEVDPTNPLKVRTSPADSASIHQYFKRANVSEVAGEAYEFRGVYYWSTMDNLGSPGREFSQNFSYRLDKPPYSDSSEPKA